VKTKAQAVSEEGTWAKLGGKGEVLPGGVIVVGAAEEPGQIIMNEVVEKEVPGVYMIEDKVEASSIFEGVGDRYNRA